MLGAAGAGMVAGLGLGLPVFALADRWLGPGWAAVAYGAVAIALAATVWALDWPVNRWNYGNVRKGVDAETRVGQVIEYAISAEGCAVAHSVSEIAVRGDIDHLVATPLGVRVVETKYRRVRGSRFPKVLEGIAANVEAVRSWVPAGVAVRGCLVLATGDAPARRSYRARGRGSGECCLR